MAAATFKQTECSSDFSFPASSNAPCVKSRVGIVTSASLLLHLVACVPMLAADAASISATGKGTTEHALDAMTGKDCRIVEGIARSDRRMCEPHHAATTERDFKGLSRQ
jgi:hypothetical protein